MAHAVRGKDLDPVVDTWKEGQGERFTNVTPRLALIQAIYLPTQVVGWPVSDAVVELDANHNVMAIRFGDKVFLPDVPRPVGEWAKRI